MVTDAKAICKELAIAPGGVNLLWICMDDMSKYVERNRRRVRSQSKNRTTPGLNSVLSVSLLQISILLESKGLDGLG